MVMYRYVPRSMLTTWALYDSPEPDDLFSCLPLREREIHYVHWASKAYEDESVFISEAHLGWQ